MRKKTTDISPEDKRLFLDAMGKSQQEKGAEVDFESMLAKESASAAGLLFKKWDGQLPKKKSRPKLTKPQRTLDLHGKTAKDALIAVENFLWQAQASDLQLVLVITGKGAGILKDEVSHRLRQHALVARFQEADRTLGGSGALLVHLKTRQG